MTLTGHAQHAHTPVIVEETAGVFRQLALIETELILSSHDSAVVSSALSRRFSSMLFTSWSVSGAAKRLPVVPRAPCKRNWVLAGPPLHPAQPAVSVWILPCTVACPASSKVTA